MVSAPPPKKKKKAKGSLFDPPPSEDVVCKERSWDWSACSSCRGPGFCLQHQVVHNCLELQLQWVQCLLLASMSSHMQAECMHARIWGKDLNFKKRVLVLESWFSGWEHWLLSQRTWIWLLALWGSSQPLLPPAQGAYALFWPPQATMVKWHSHTQMYTHTHIIKI